MALPLIAGMLLKGVASNVIGGALGGNQQGASDPITSIFSSVLGGGQEGSGDLLGTLLKGPLNLLG